MRHDVPAVAINPRRRAGIRPQFTSEDLPLPEVPTTARKRVARQLVDHGVDLALASKEEVLFVLVERPEPGKRVRQPGAGCGLGAHGLAFPETAFTKSAKLLPLKTRPGNRSA